MALDILRAALVNCAMVLVAQPNVEVNPQWLDKAKSEVRSAYDRYDAMSAQIEEVFDQQLENDPSDSRSKGFRNKKSRVSTARLGFESYAAVTTAFEASKDEPSTRLDCNNEKYHFTLTKRNPASPYVMIAYVPEKLPVGRVFATGIAMHRSAFRSLYWLLGALEGKEGYSLRRLQWDDGRRLVHVHVRFDNPRDDLNRPPTQENEMWVDPINNWRIVDAKQTAASGVTSTKLTYGKTVDGLAFPSESEVTLTAAPKMMSPSCKLLGKVVSIAKTTKTTADFRLSAFNLPEPRGTAPEKALPNYIWLIGAFLACAVLATGCWYMRRRWQAQPAE